MEVEKNLINTCNLREAGPIMMALPYPPTQVSEKNLSYANLLSIDYCGSVSEMSAIAQYINNQNRLSCDSCPMATVILGIAMAEMIHMKKLGELIFLLGGNIDYIAKYNNGNLKMWTPKDLAISDNPKEMLIRDMEAERAAINQYASHMKMIKDSHVNAVLARIIKDEEYHIAVLKALLEE